MKINVHSHSESDIIYEVDLSALACTCPHFRTTLHKLPSEDPRRLCKHIIQVILQQDDIPEAFRQYKDDIECCAKYKTSFKPKSELINKPCWNQKESLPDGFIETISSIKKKKYCHLEGRGDGRKIYAQMPMAGGIAKYTINSMSFGTYDLQNQISETASYYKYMEQAIINWLVDEYNKIKNPDASLALKTSIGFTPRPDKLPVGTIRILSVSNHKGIIEFSNGYIDPDEDDKYFISAIAGNDKIEAYISQDKRIIQYSINGSRPYYYDLNPEVSETEGALGVKLVITCDMSSDFPKKYNYMKDAFFHWLNEVVVNIGDRESRTSRHKAGSG